MALNKGGSDWLRRWFGIGEQSCENAIAILRQRYIEESQHVSRFTQHAEKMQYPQYREKLLRIATEEAKHVEWIAAKIKVLGGALPAVTETESTAANSWQYLLADLEEHRVCAAELLETIRSLRAVLPGVADMLQRIYDDGEKHRTEIRQMLMRSDPQSLWAA